MGNIDKFETIANIYDTAERVQLAKVSSDAVRECLVDTKSKNAIDFGCGTGLVGMNAYFGHIRTLIPAASGQRNGIIRTAFR